MTLPPDPIQLQPTYDLAKAAFEAQPPIRVLFDNGAGNSNPGWPYPGFERSFSSFPDPGHHGSLLVPRAQRRARDQPPAQHRCRRVHLGRRCPAADRLHRRHRRRRPGLWTATPNYQWTQDPDRSAVAYVTAPLSGDTTVVGAGRVDVWVRSSTPNVDLQATISEVRPDGKETFVQNGWVRGNMRKLDEAKSTLLEPVLSLRERDVAPMPPTASSEVTIPLYYQGHMYRAGSRIRVRITAPNGDQPIWSFGETEPAGPARRFDRLRRRCRRASSCRWCRA